MRRWHLDSIARRLLLASIAILPVFLGVTGYAIERAHSHSLVTAEQDRLRLHFYGLLGAMEWENDAINMERLREPHFWQFRSGLYAAISDTEGRLQWQSPSAWTLSLPFMLTELPRRGRESFDQVDESDGPGFFRLRYHLLWEDEANREIPLVVTLLASKQSYLDEKASFRRQILLWLSGAALILLLIQTAVLRWGLSPLRQLANELVDLEHGGREQLAGDYPEELRGVTRNLNRLLERERRQRERYRNTLADLAHSLKTPLSVLKGLFSQDDKAPPPAVVHEQLERMDNIIGYQLQRAVSDGSARLGKRRPIRPVLDRLLDTLAKVYRHKPVQVAVNVPASLLSGVDDEDLMELLGNLLDNAFKACRSQILIDAEQRGDHIAIGIADDGPGIDATVVDQLLQRGRRGDQYQGGQGLGLAIVADIVTAYGGDIEVGSREGGGALLKLILPNR